MLSYSDFSSSSVRSNVSRSCRRVFYDKIVDRSMYRPDAEDVRSQKLRANGSSSGDVGLYDYQDGKVNFKIQPSAIEISLRQNQLDKADIQKIRTELNKKARSAVETYKEQQELRAADNAQKSRQEVMDSLLGVKDSAK